MNQFIALALSSVAVAAPSFSKRQDTDALVNLVNTLGTALQGFADSLPVAAKGLSALGGDQECNQKATSLLQQWYTQCLGPALSTNTTGGLDFYEDLLEDVCYNKGCWAIKWDLLAPFQQECEVPQEYISTFPVMQYYSLARRGSRNAICDLVVEGYQDKTGKDQSIPDPYHVVPVVLSTAYSLFTGILSQPGGCDDRCRQSLVSSVCGPLFGPQNLVFWEFARYVRTQNELKAAGKPFDTFLLIFGVSWEAISYDVKFIADFVCQLPPPEQATTAGLGFPPLETEVASYETTDPAPEPIATVAEPTQAAASAAAPPSGGYTVVLSTREGCLEEGNPWLNVAGCDPTNVHQQFVLQQAGEGQFRLTAPQLTPGSNCLGGVEATRNFSQGKANPFFGDCGTGSVWAYNATTSQVQWVDPAYGPQQICLEEEVYESGSLFYNACFAADSPLLYHQQFKAAPFTGA